ncbi:MAG: glycerophosphodiester phosphodiesterase family protein [Opitutaceae bacterium]
MKSIPRKHPRLLIGTILLACIFPSAVPAETALNGQTPVVIGHRGASGYRPEHTLAAYKLAIEQGAQFIEPDLVSTKDGVLIARHEPLLAIYNEATNTVGEATTNVAELPQFAARRTTRILDGIPLNGWWAQDFTLAEIKTLKARERIPAIRPANVAFNDQFEIPTLQEVITLAQTQTALLGRTIGIYPETKHPTYHDSIGLSLEEPLINALKANGLAGADAAVFIQSFEVANLKEINLRPDISVPLVQLFGGSGQPYDFTAAGNPTTYDQMGTAAGLAQIATYANGVGPNKNRVIPMVGANLGATPTSFVPDAHAVGLLVHPYTYRRENTFLPNQFDSSANPIEPGDLRGEILAYLAAGIDGFFTDNPDIGTGAVQRFTGGGFFTSIKPYVVPTASSPYEIVPILSVGDKVPESSDATKDYQMVGIPDGIGAHSNRDGTITLYLNHELGNTVQSQATIPGPLERGAFVSKYTLAANGSVLSGERAYDWVFDVEKGLVLPAPTSANSTRGFARFCSGAFAGIAEGFDRPIYFAGEESSGAATFDGKGGLEVAIIDNVLYTLPKLGHFAWENALPRPFQGNEVVIMCMEDGPFTPDSQLWMYVGKKDHRAGASVLDRNGLNNGKLYAFRSKNLAKNSEVTFTSGSVVGEWVEIPNAEHLTDVQLEAAADAAQAFGFIRTEDGAWSKTSRKDYYFCTTGSEFPNAGGTPPNQGVARANRLGRIYHLELNPGNPLKDATLTVLVNADHVIAAGGDTAISPDNMDVSGDYLMVNEDGTAESRVVMAAKSRDGSVWRFPLSDIRAATGQRVAQLNPPGRDGVPVGPGIWETSGTIDATTLFGPNTWIMDVQAHGPTRAPAPNTVEDGQLVIMAPKESAP